MKALAPEIHHYYLNLKQKVIIGNLMTASEACSTIEDRFKNYKDQYDDADQSLADGMFGFQRDGNNNFVELSIISTLCFLCKFEHKAFREIGPYRHSWTVSYDLESRGGLEEAKDIVRCYYDLAQDEFVEKLKELGAKKSGSAFSLPVSLALLLFVLCGLYFRGYLS